GHSQRTCSRWHQGGGCAASEASDLSCHVRLIGISSDRGQVRERGWAGRSVCEIKESLKAQHRLKHFWTVADGRRKTPLELPVAESDPLAQLLNGCVWAARKPSDTCHNRAIWWRSGGSSASQGPGQHRFQRNKRWLIERKCDARSICAPHLR